MGITFPSENRVEGVIMEVGAIIAIGSAVYALASEIIGLNKGWESNSVVQVIMGVLSKVFKR